MRSHLRLLPFLFASIWLRLARNTGKHRKIAVSRRLPLCNELYSFVIFELSTPVWHSCLTNIPFPGTFLLLNFPLGLCLRIFAHIFLPIVLTHWLPYLHTHTFSSLSSSLSFHIPLPREAHPRHLVASWCSSRLIFIKMWYVPFENGVRRVADPIIIPSLCTLSTAKDSHPLLLTEWRTSMLGDRTVCSKWLPSCRPFWGALLQVICPTGEPTKDWSEGTTHKSVTLSGSEERTLSSRNVLDYVWLTLAGSLSRVWM